MNLNSLLIKITAAIFLLYGIGFIVLPHELSIWVTGVAPTTGTAIADMRATYGGMSIAVGVLMFMLASKSETIRLGLVAVITFMLGMAGGRTVGIIADSPVNSLMYYYLALEISVAAAGFILLHRSRNS